MGGGQIGKREGQGGGGVGSERRIGAKGLVA